MANAMKKRGIKKSKKTLGKPSVIAQLKKNILNPRVGTSVLTNKITGGRTKLKGSPKTKFKIVKKSLKDFKKRLKEGRIKL